MPIDLYYMSLSPSCRAVLITAKHLGLELNVKDVDLLKGEHLTEEFLKLNPSHTVPTLDDDGFVLWESRAIMQYLCNQYAPDSPLYPIEPKKRAIVDRMLNFDMTYNRDIHTLVVSIYKSKELTAQEIENYKKSLKLMDTIIGDNKFVAGDEMTIADIAIGQSTTMLAINEWEDLAENPNLSSYLDRIRSESSFFSEISDKAYEEFKAFIASKKTDQE